jgi:hypothetical protein
MSHAMCPTGLIPMNRLNWHYLSSISDSKCAAYMAERNVDKLVAVTVSERG